ncbi:hypothetical protein [Weissella confusa]
MRLFFRLKWFIKQEWRSYLMGILSLTGVAIFGLMPPAMIGNFVNLLADNRFTWEAIWQIVGLILLATIGQYILRFGWSYFIWGTSARLERVLRIRLLSHYLEMDKPFSNATEQVIYWHTQRMM